MRPVREKTYQDHTFALSLFHLRLMMTILFTSRWNSFLIVLAWWRLANCSPILLWERLFFFGHVFTYLWSPWGCQASSIWSLLDAHLELALHFFIWQNMFTIIRYFHYYKPCSEFFGFHFFILHHVNVLEVHTRAHSTLVFKTYLS